MRVVILAAGKGSRFNDPETPKTLTPLANGLSILEFQLLHFEKFLSLDAVEIVVGFHKEKIMSKFPNLKYVDNPNYAHENTAKSLLRTMEPIETDLLWVNGDVVFHPSVLEKMIRTYKTSMVVNVGEVGAEEVKYRTDSAGNIIEVSKTVHEGEGEALGINLFLAADRIHLKKSLQRCTDKDYFEKGIELCIQEGMQVQALPVEHSLCAEIDFPKDLDYANNLIRSW